MIRFGVGYMTNFFLKFTIKGHSVFQLGGNGSHAVVDPEKVMGGHEFFFESTFYNFKFFRACTKNVGHVRNLQSADLFFCSSGICFRELQ